MRAVILLCVFAVVYGSPLPDEDYDVIVVGLGPSGVMAASKLAKAGQKVLGLEAQDRIGGRVRTVPFGDTTVELGAEWIHGTEGSLTFQIATENNITLKAQSFTSKVQRSDSTPASSDVVNDIMNYTMSLYELPNDPIHESMGVYLTKKIREYVKTKYPEIENDKDYMDNLLILLEEIIDNYESASSWNDVSTASHYEALEGSQQISWGRLGYKTLFDILLNNYNNGPGLPSLTIKLNTEVVQVKWPKDAAGHVEVTTKDGTIYKGRAAIVTVSLGVLKKRHTTLFTPPLPEEKSHAIEVISFGIVDKLTFRFPYKWMDTDFVAFLWKNKDLENIPQGDKWLTRSEGISIPMSCDTCVTFWINGERAKFIESLPEEELKTKAIAVIRQFIGPNVTVPDPVETIRSTWYTNPFTLGSYSYEGLLTSENPNARVDLAKPLLDASGNPRVLFAGEATNPTHFSTVHGALETGVREASRLISSVA